MEIADVPYTVRIPPVFAWVVALSVHQTLRRIKLALETLEQAVHLDLRSH